MNTTEQIYQLVEQWCQTLNPSQSSEALRQIALITGCLPQVSKPLTENETKCVMQWLQENHPNAYLWAMSQRWVGHPAIVWGSNRRMQKTSWLYEVATPV